MSLIQYHSPFNILDLHPEEGKVNKRQLKLSKKRLLAEFDLHNSVTIELKGKTFDKNAILRLFDELDSNVHLAHHIRIFNSLFLLSFLETGNLQSYDRIMPKELEGGKGFVNFAGLYFSNRFNQILTAAVKDKDLSVLEFLMEKELPLGAKFFDDCFKGAYRYFAGKIREIETFSTGSREKYLPESYLSKFYESSEIQILNLLPEYFSGLKDRYGRALKDLAIALYNDHRRVASSKKVLKRGLELKAGIQVIAEIQDILDQIQKLTSPSGRLGWNGNENDNNQKSWNVGVFLFLFVLIFSLSRTCDPGPSTSYNFNLNDFNSRPDNFEGLFKSLKSDETVELSFFDVIDNPAKRDLFMAEQNKDQIRIKRPETGDQPYSAYFKASVNDLFNFSSLFTPRDELVIVNKGPYDAVFFLETVFGLVDHYYIRSQETLKLNRLTRMETDMKMHVWFGENWHCDEDDLQGELNSGFIDGKGWTPKDTLGNELNRSIGKPQGEFYKIKVVEVSVSLPGEGFERTIKSKLVPGIISSKDRIEE